MNFVERFEYFQKFIQHPNPNVKVILGMIIKSLVNDESNLVLIISEFKDWKPEPEVKNNIRVWSEDTTDDYIDVEIVEEIQKELTLLGLHSEVKKNYQDYLCIKWNKEYRLDHFRY